MPRGGRRAGRSGKAYQNRTDLNPSAQAAQVTRAPRIRAPQGVPTQGLQQTPQAATAAPPVQPQALGPAAGASPFDRPTERPEEPLTEGLAIGPGRGPEVLSQPTSTASQELRALFLRYPLPELRELIEELDAEEMNG